jgi:hypothetical protein
MTYRDEVKWVGCGECDPIFRCHNGEAPCMRGKPSAEPVAQWRHHLGRLDWRVVDPKRLPSKDWQSLFSVPDAEQKVWLKTVNDFDAELGRQWLRAESAEANYAGCADTCSRLHKRIRDLEAELEEYQHGKRLPDGWCQMGVGDGSGSLFVYGPYDAIKRSQDMVLRAEAAMLGNAQWQKRAMEASLEIGRLGGRAEAAKSEAMMWHGKLVDAEAEKAKLREALREASNNMRKLMECEADQRDCEQCLAHIDALLRADAGSQKAGGGA